MANPFDDDVEISNFYKPQNKTAKGVVPNSSSLDDVNFYEQQIEQILQNSVDSSGRGLRMLDESEQVGLATAQDLVAQGEKLQKVDKQLTDINSTTKQSQKHLNNIKSIFGGVKNYFASKTDRNAKQSMLAVAEEPNKSSQLNGIVSKLCDVGDENRSGFIANQNNVGSSLPEASRAALAGTRWEILNNQVDENLDSMTSQLRRLQQLGSAMGRELDDQNVLLDKITTKTERTDVVIRHQDKQMKKLLGTDKVQQTKGAESQQTLGAEESTVPSIFSKFKK